MESYLFRRAFLCPLENLASRIRSFLASRFLDNSISSSWFTFTLSCCNFIASSASVLRRCCCIVSKGFCLKAFSFIVLKLVQLAWMHKDIKHVRSIQTHRVLQYQSHMRYLPVANCLFWFIAIGYNYTLSLHIRITLRDFRVLGQR